ncbi:adenosylcobinamide-phosphate synthase CbiB [Paenibacillus thailandensis]|uniref:Cobalamin biosynthesis protein CobD n=1 Tax=Paenibacillus thailandensis TaxID=393250 RepID=A0ABW5R1M2_9BACL
MIFYSLQEMLLIIAAAIAIDWIVGDPKWPTHPVIWIGRLIRRLERRLRPEGTAETEGRARRAGVLLTLITLAASFSAAWAVTALCAWVHPWLGYAASAWLVSTTIAVKGLKDAAMLVYKPLTQGKLEEARTYAGHIVGRDTDRLTEGEAARAAIETVAENTVDALVSPLVFALLGAAPLAMLYRAANTLDSMVGYRNETYLHFGWCSARTDDALNYVPARLAGLLMVVSAALLPRMSPVGALRAVLRFARKHPSPNSGIPESAAAGAMGIELGGLNYYFGRPSERARMGWPKRPIAPAHILGAIRLLYAVSVCLWGGALIGWLIVT